ncbi:unnamed protein product [Arctia plantaginis]|uniref:Brain protein I3 n=1 Tax=Arctia plantaginis TaxID=874455 RepID=A0A8S1BRK2_ARCPL|nr:unnamed protein product [Arctia plantaginis]
MEKPTVTELPPPYTATVPPGPSPQPAGAPGAPYPPPPPGYTPYGVAPPGAGFVPNYGATNIIIPPPIIAVGACPACRVGILEDDFTCLALSNLTNVSGFEHVSNSLMSMAYRIRA